MEMGVKMAFFKKGGYRFFFEESAIILTKIYFQKNKINKVD